MSSRNRGGTAPGIAGIRVLDLALQVYTPLNPDYSDYKLTVVTAE